MKAENLEVLVRDLVDTIGVPNLRGLPLHLLIAEAKAYTVQKNADQARYIQKLEGDVETLTKSESDALTKLKEVMDRHEALSDDKRMFQIQVRDLLDRFDVDIPEDDRKIGMDEIRKLFAKIDETLEKVDEAKEKNDALLSIAHHGQMVWLAERTDLECQVGYWKKVAVDLMSGHASGENLHAEGDELDFVNTLRRRRDNLPEGKERDRLSKFLAPFEKRRS